MSVPNVDAKHLNCWHQIVYALLRWTLPAALAVVVVVLTR